MRKSLKAALCTLIILTASLSFAKDLTRATKSHGVKAAGFGNNDELRRPREDDAKVGTITSAPIPSPGSTAMRNSSMPHPRVASGFVNRP